MGTVNQLFRSSTGFVSPYFAVDGAGNLLTQTITVTGTRLELTKNSYVSYNGAPLLTGNALGSSITSIPGTLTGLTVAGDINITGNINIQGAVVQGGPQSNVTGEINNVNLGNITPGVGNFTTLTSTGTASVSLTNTGAVTIGPTGNVVISPTGNITISSSLNTTIAPLGTISISSVTTGNINNVAIGQTTASTGRFTQVKLTANDELFGSDVTQAATKRYVEAALIMGYFAGVSSR
jgi:hypothetical protein